MFKRGLTYGRSNVAKLFEKKNILKKKICMIFTKILFFSKNLFFSNKVMYSK